MLRASALFRHRLPGQRCQVELLINISPVHNSFLFLFFNLKIDSIWPRYYSSRNSVKPITYFQVPSHSFFFYSIY